MEYRGIKLVANVKLFKKNGDYSQKIKNGLDVLADTLIKNGHEILSEYLGNHDKVLIDFKCGHEVNWVKPSNYKNGDRCPKCGNINRAEKRSKQAKEEFPLLVQSSGHEWVDGEYINARTKVKIDFKCNHDPNWITPDNYKKGYGCPECGTINASEKIINQSKDELTSLVESNGHSLLSEYITAKKKVRIDFNCNHKPHWITPNSYKNGIGCPICSESKGEKRIRKCLDENNFTFESQREFDGLTGLGGGNLSYDFYLPKQNILIEYQGEFHDGSGAEYTRMNLESQQEHDKRKREYAKQHDIELLEIWYWNFDNIEETLQNKLNK